MAQGQRGVWVGFAEPEELSGTINAAIGSRYGKVFMYCQGQLFYFSLGLYRRREVTHKPKAKWFQVGGVEAEQPFLQAVAPNVLKKRKLILCNCITINRNYWLDSGVRWTLKIAGVTLLRLRFIWPLPSLAYRQIRKFSEQHYP